MHNAFTSRRLVADPKSHLTNTPTRAKPVPISYEHQRVGLMGSVRACDGLFRELMDDGAFLGGVEGPRT